MILVHQREVTGGSCTGGVALAEEAEVAYHAILSVGSLLLPFS